jgi:hypothetical protein
MGDHDSLLRAEKPVGDDEGPERVVRDDAAFAGSRRASMQVTTAKRLAGGTARLLFVKPSA